MIRTVALILALILALCALFALGLRRLCQWLIDRDTRRRVHAAIKRQIAVDQLRRYREDDLDRRSADYLKSRSKRNGDGR